MIYKKLFSQYFAPQRANCVPKFPKSTYRTLNRYLEQSEWKFKKAEFNAE